MLTQTPLKSFEKPIKNELLEATLSQIKEDFPQTGVEVSKLANLSADEFKKISSTLFNRLSQLNKNPDLDQEDKQDTLFAIETFRNLAALTNNPNAETNITQDYTEARRLLILVGNGEVEENQMNSKKSTLESQLQNKILDYALSGKDISNADITKILNQIVASFNEIKKETNNETINNIISNQDPISETIPTSYFEPENLRSLLTKGTTKEQIALETVTDSSIESDKASFLRYAKFLPQARLINTILDFSEQTSPLTLFQEQRISDLYRVVIKFNNGSLSEKMKTLLQAAAADARNNNR
jgi:hypothetical protein